MKILVTGTEGYLGSLIAPLLMKHGHELVGVDTGFYKEGWLYNGSSVTARTLVKDIRDISAEDLRGMEAVVHTAELSNDPTGELAPNITYDINHKGSVRLAELAKAAGVTRFVYMSSCSVYGVAQGDVPVNEESSVNPQTAYAKCKVLVEQDLKPMAGDHFSPTFLRNATAYGFSPRLRGDLVVNDLVGHALLAGNIGLRSNGMAWRPLVHADDIASAFIALLEAPRDVVHARAYNVGHSDENYLVRDIANLVQEIVGGEVTFAEGAGADARNYRVTCDRIAAEVPEFKPQWTVRKGIEQLVENYKRYDLQLTDLFGERHQRLKKINALHAAGKIGSDLRWTESAR